MFSRDAVVRASRGALGLAHGNASRSIGRVMGFLSHVVSFGTLKDVLSFIMGTFGNTGICEQGGGA